MNNSTCIESLCKNIAIFNQKYCVDCICCMNCNNYRDDENILCETCENNFDENNFDDLDDNIFDDNIFDNYNNVTNNNKILCNYPFCTNYSTDNTNCCRIHKSCASCSNNKMDNNIFCNRCLYI